MSDNRLRGTLKVRADWLNVSGDTLDFECQAFLVSKRVLCCGTDNPFILFERARVLNEPEVPALTPRVWIPDNKETEPVDPEAIIDIENPMTERGLMSESN
jgi:hypothetical protein